MQGHASRDAGERYGRNTPLTTLSSELAKIDFPIDFPRIGDAFLVSAGPEASFSSLGAGRERASPVTQRLVLRAAFEFDRRDESYRRYTGIAGLNLRFGSPQQ